MGNMDEKRQLLSIQNLLWDELPLALTDASSEKYSRRIFRQTVRIVSKKFEIGEDDLRIFKVDGSLHRQVIESFDPLQLLVHRQFFQVNVDADFKRHVGLTSSDSVWQKNFLWQGYRMDLNDRIRWPSEYRTSQMVNSCPAIWSKWYTLVDS